MTQHPALTETTRRKVFDGLDDYANAIANHLINGQWSGARGLFNQVPEKRRPYVTWVLCQRTDIADQVERLVIHHVD